MAPFVQKVNSFFIYHLNAGKYMLILMPNIFYALRKIRLQANGKRLNKIDIKE